MHSTPVVVCLPIADRRASFAFYRDGLGLEPRGEPAADGVPEPLQFTLNEGLRVMLVPTGGFDLITGDHDTAPSGYSECVLTIATKIGDGVQELIDSAHAAGATIVTAVGQQPWGYAGAFADPDGHIWMVRSDGQTA